MKKTRMLIALIAGCCSLCLGGHAATLRPDQIVRRYGSAVVLIIATNAEGKTKQGTGFLITPDGVLVTNQHVMNGAVSARVHLTNGQAYDVRKVLASDISRDLALLKIAASKLPVVKLGNSGSASVGSQVYVIGNPEGLANTISDGLLSGRREVDGVRLLQITAPISPGSSGSPVFDSEGRVIGVAVASLRDGQNLNFAIPVTYVRNLSSQSSGLNLAKPPRVAHKPVQPIPSVPTPECVLRGHLGEVTQITWSPDGRQFLSRGKDGTLRAWDASTREQLAVLHTSGAEDAVADMVWRRDGKQFAYTDKGRVRLWDLATLTETDLAQPDAEYVHDLRWNPRFPTLAWIADGTVAVWDSTSGGFPKYLTDPTQDPAISLAWSPDGARLAGSIRHRTATANEALIWVWSTRTLEVSATVSGFAWDVAWNPDGRRLAILTGSESYTVDVWDAVAARSMAIADYSHADFPGCNKWSPDGARIAIFPSRQDGQERIEVWGRATSTANWARQAVLFDLQGDGYVVWSPDGTKLAWITQLTDDPNKNAHVKIWDATSKQQKVVTDLGILTGSISWSPDGRYLAALSGTGVRIWNIVTRRTVALSHTDRATTSANCMEWSPDGKRVAVGYDDGSVRIWNGEQATKQRDRTGDRQHPKRRGNDAHHPSRR